VSIYTPPATNAVDFALTVTTPPDMTPYGVALSVYTPPATNAVDFALTAFTPPTFPYVGWELLPSNNVTGSAAFGQGSGTFAGTGIRHFDGTAAFGQGSGTFAALMESGTPAPPAPTPSGMGGSGAGVNFHKNLATLQRDINYRHQRALRMKRRRMALLLLLAP